ncbi:MAG TPA: hypothetical protein VL330_17530 [Actinomycetes bacterium]|nr:hypothetical protein [Actinomycetes bacterium]
MVLTLILLVVGLFINRENSLGFLASSEGVPTGGFLSAFLLSGLLGIWVLTASRAPPTWPRRPRWPASGCPARWSSRCSSRSSSGS